MDSRRYVPALACLALLLGPPRIAAGDASAPGPQSATYGGAIVPGGAGRPTTRIPGYSLAFPPRWTARLWPDSLAGYGQLDLSSPAGSTIDLTLIPLHPRGPTPSALVAHDRAFLTSARQDRVVLPLGPAVRLSGVASPASAGMTSQILYLQRGALLYRLFSTQPSGSAESGVLLRVAASLRVVAAGGPSRVPTPPPAALPACCHCPAWGAGWGTVLTRLDGVPVYWNGGDVNNGCVGTYGILYQCVELVQRYFAQRWGYPAVWSGVGAAADMRASHPAGIQFIPNGGTPGPQEGDALVFYGGAVGHVALVGRVDRPGGQIDLVEENWSPTGAASLPLYADSTIGIRDSAYGSYVVAGWLHSPRNTPVQG